MALESLDVIPWGPGELRLRTPLQVEVTSDGNDTVLVLQAIGNGTIWGSGKDFAEALVDLACLIERIIEENARESDRLLEHLPDDAV